MRFLQLDLKAVGPFTGVSLDLASAGLHLIVGPNEAGKSSALRAISYLLFNFPHEVPEARFVHDYPKLRVGGVLQGSRGDVLEIVRRKRILESLVSPDESAVIPESRLQEMLGRIERSTFENLLGIDHARLRLGGKQIRDGRGEFAGLLFAAGAGLSGLRTAQSQLLKRMNELYLDRGKNPRINVACQEIKQAKEELNQRILLTDVWREHDEAFREASRRREELAGRIVGLRLELQRNQRIGDAIPIDARRRRILEDLRQLGEVPSLRPGFGDEVRSVMDRKQEAALLIKRSEERLGKFAEQLESLPDPSAWLADAGAIEALQQDLGVVEKAALDRSTNLEKMLNEDEHAARDLLRGLQQPTDLTAAQELLPRPDEPVAIEALAKQRVEEATRADETRKAIRRYEQQLARLDSRKVDPPPDIEDLRRSARSARNAGELDATWAAAVKKSKSAERDLARALAQLADWRGDADSLRDLPTPLNATIHHYEKEFQKLDQDGQRLRDDRERNEAECREIEVQLRALQLNLDVPTESDLAEARKARDLEWRAIRQSWLDGELPSPRRKLAKGLDLGIARSDALADRLRREAEGVARKSDAVANLERLRVARSELEHRVERQEQAARQLADRWDSIVEPIGLPGKSTAEVREWLKARDGVIQLLDRAEEARRIRDDIDTQRRSAIDAVRDALRPHVEDDGGMANSLGPLLDLADSIVKQADTIAQQCRDQEQRRHTAEEELEAARTALKVAEDRLGPILESWAAWMARIHLEPTASTEQADVVLKTLEQLRIKLASIRGHRSRLAGMDRYYAKFAARVVELAHRLLPERAESSHEDLARELAQRLTRAREWNQERATLERERQQEDERFREARDRLAAAEEHLIRLAGEAGVADPSELLKTEGLSLRKAELERQKAECDDQLLGFAAGRDWDDFRNQLESAEADTLAIRIDLLHDQLREFQEELDRVNQTIGAEQAELARMRGGDEGADAADQVQELLTRGRNDVEQYATLKLADAILRRGIDRYRSANQGPVLGRAGELFRVLTDGSFAALRIEDDEGLAVLQGVRPDGRAIGVDGMSDGTHDQLYLALRLAVLESWLESHEPIPLVVDDILLTFDDRRSAAALRALAEFSSKTQVLMFTHHAHLIDLAREAVPSDRLSVLELPAPTSMANAPAVG